MQTATRFSVAIHVLLCVEVFRDVQKVTSDFISSSVNTNPVVIRRIMGLLREAGLIEIAPGTGGIKLTRESRDITLLDIYRSTEIGEKGKLFRIHEDTAPGCPVGGNISDLLGGYFDRAQKSMERELSGSTLADLLSDLSSLRKRKASASR
jgi:DNA-binding IscR family transcriptional regulator